jgi:hypothetical protein
MTELHRDDVHDASAHPPAEEDRIGSRAIVLVGVGALIVFFVASLAAIGAMKRQQSRLIPDGPAPLPAELGQSKIGLLEQRLFENSNQADVVQRVQRSKLESYGWVDPAQGIIRIPIERGYELVLAGERPEGSPSTAIGKYDEGTDRSGSAPAGPPAGSRSGGESPPRNGASR